MLMTPWFINHSLSMRRPTAESQVVEQLDSCMQISLRGFFARMQSSGSSVGGEAWSGTSLEVYGPR